MMHSLRAAAACLIVYWLKGESNVLHWLVESLLDVVFRSTPQGTGTEFLLKKFGYLSAIMAKYGAHVDML